MNDMQNIVEIYGVYVQTITANEQRRQALSAFYLSVVAAGIALLASEKEIEYLAIAVPISIVSLVWLSTIQYFRNCNYSAELSSYLFFTILLSPGFNRIKNHAPIM
ncbi:hypothetical protein BMR04_15250 [Methylococcaceae bacterium HT3]|nr:hypothetical protein BMR04_15250 [Methylococcaceae bacterium HT3]